MPLDEREIRRMIVAAGYEPATPVAVGVSRPSKTVLVAQRGTATGPDFDCDSVAYAGSLAKQVTGACVAGLVQDGALDVEAAIDACLPELPAWAATIRVRHLVHHTAGLPSTDAVWDRMTSLGDIDWTSDGVIAALSTFDEPAARPGVVYAYSNVGYICLARIVERLSGTHLDAFAREHFFGPLQMPATMLWPGPSPSPPSAALPPPDPPTPLSVGDGGLWTSVRDLLRWNDALVAGTVAVADTMHTTGALDDGTPLEYAWGVRVFRDAGIRVQSHGGSWDRATAKLVRLPDLGAGYAVLAYDGSVERMTTLSSSLQDELVRCAAAARD